MCLSMTGLIWPKYGADRQARVPVLRLSVNTLAGVLSRTHSCLQSVTSSNIFAGEMSLPFTELNMDQMAQRAEEVRRKYLLLSSFDSRAKIATCPLFTH